MKKSVRATSLSGTRDEFHLYLRDSDYQSFTNRLFEQFHQNVPDYDEDELIDSDWEQVAKFGLNMCTMPSGIYERRFQIQICNGKSYIHLSSSSEVIVVEGKVLEYQKVCRVYKSSKNSKTFYEKLRREMKKCADAAGNELYRNGCISNKSANTDSLTRLTLLTVVFCKEHICIKKVDYEENFNWTGGRSPAFMKPINSEYFFPEYDVEPPEKAYDNIFEIVQRLQ